MDHYHIPHHIWGMSTSYLGDNKLWFQSAMFTTKWQPVEKGIETGFTISPILFVTGDEPDHLCSDYKVKRTKGCCRKSTAGNQGIHGRPYRDNTDPCAGKMGLGGTGWNGYVGKDDPQAQKVKVPGDPKRQNNWKVQAVCLRRSGPEPPREPNQIPWKVIRPFPVRQEKHLQHRAANADFTWHLRTSKIRVAGITTRSGRRWVTNTAVNLAESALWTKDIIENPCTGR